MFSKGRENEPASAGTLMKQIEHLLAENHDLKIKHYELILEIRRIRDSRPAEALPLLQVA